MFFLSRKEAMYQVPVSIATLVNRMPCHEKGEEGERNYIFLGLFLRGKTARVTQHPFSPLKRHKNIFVIVSRSYLRTVSWPTGWLPSSAPD